MYSRLTEFCETTKKQHVFKDCPNKEPAQVNVKELFFYVSFCWFVSPYAWESVKEVEQQRRTRFCDLVTVKPHDEEKRF